MSQLQRSRSPTSDDNLPAPPACCRRPMMLASIEPLNHGNDLRTYYCVVCTMRQVVEVHYTNPTRRGPERQVR